MSSRKSRIRRHCRREGVAVACLTIADLRGAGRLDGLLTRTGLTPRNVDEYLGGRRPAPWVMRAIAEAAGVEPEVLWPPLDGGPLHRGSLDDHRARRASERNLGAGVSRGGRHTNEEF